MLSFRSLGPEFVAEASPEEEDDTKSQKSHTSMVVSEVSETPEKETLEDVEMKDLDERIADMNKEELLRFLDHPTLVELQDITDSDGNTSKKEVRFLAELTRLFLIIFAFQFIISILIKIRFKLRSLHNRQFSVRNKHAMAFDRGKYCPFRSQSFILKISYIFCGLLIFLITNLSHHQHDSEIHHIYRIGLRLHEFECSMGTVRTYLEFPERCEFSLPYVGLLQGLPERCGTLVLYLAVGFPERCGFPDFHKHIFYSVFQINQQNLCHLNNFLHLGIAQCGSHDGSETFPCREGPQGAGGQTLAQSIMGSKGHRRPNPTFFYFRGGVRLSPRQGIG